MVFAAIAAFCFVATSLNKNYRFPFNTSKPLNNFSSKSNISNQKSTVYRKFDFLLYIGFLILWRRFSDSLSPSVKPVLLFAANFSAGIARSASFSV